MHRPPTGTVWISQKTYKHPLDKAGSFYYRIILLNTNIYSMLGMTGELRSCQQSWAKEIHNEEIASDSLPELIGLKEVTEILGWHKAKVSTYDKRGKLPEPIQRLASGPIWRKSDIEKFKESVRKMKIKVTQIINGKTIRNHEGEGNNLAACISNLPEDISNNIYREADERVSGQFENAEFPLEGEELKRYNEAISEVLEDALWSYCDRNNYKLEIEPE